MSGKGSKTRPLSVDPKTFSNNWDNIFNGSHDACGTVDCCMSCDTATPSKDWYLIAINPWHKWYVNSKSGEHKHIPYK